MSGVLTVIVAHVNRAHHLPELESITDAARVFLDDGTLGEWGNHEQALRWAAQAATEKNLSHVCVVQDDALPVEGFVSYVNTLALLRPDDMIGLYVGTHRPHREPVTTAVNKADDAGAMFLSHKELCWGVATLMPADAIVPMLDAVVKSKRPYDTRLGRGWAAVTGKLVLYVWPSLVDHRDERTVIAGRSRAQGVRRARRVGPLAGDQHEVVPILTEFPSARRRRERAEQRAR